MRITDPARATLRRRLRRFARDMSTPQADDVLDAILAGWAFRDCAQLSQLADVLATPTLSASGVLFWLHATLAIEQTQAGNEAVFARGFRAALRLGVSAELLARLQAHAVPPPGETRH